MLKYSINQNVIAVCATGGGAYKFEADIRSELNMSLHKVRLGGREQIRGLEGGYVSV